MNARKWVAAKTDGVVPEVKIFETIDAREKYIKKYVAGGGLMTIYRGEIIGQLEGFDTIIWENPKFPRTK